MSNHFSENNHITLGIAGTGMSAEEVFAPTHDTLADYGDVAYLTPTADMLKKPSVFNSEVERHIGAYASKTIIGLSSGGLLAIEAAREQTNTNVVTIDPPVGLNNLRDDERNALKALRRVPGMMASPSSLVAAKLWKEREQREQEIMMKKFRSEAYRRDVQARSAISLALVAAQLLRIAKYPYDTLSLSEDTPLIHMRSKYDRLVLGGSVDALRHQIPHVIGQEVASSHAGLSSSSKWPSAFVEMFQTLGVQPIDQEILEDDEISA
jgi:hypothetical protein